MQQSPETTLERLNRWWSWLVAKALFRLVLVTLTGFFLSYSYKEVNETFRPCYDFSLPIDNYIPFWPLSGLVYWSYYGLFVGGAIVVRPTLFTRAWVGVLVCNLSSYVAYFFFCAHVPHPDITFVQPEWLAGMYRDFYMLDGPGNTLPSLHCALSALLGWNIRKHSKWWLFWAFAISLSTLTTKEHVFLDLVAGWLLAAVVQRTVVRPELDEPDEPEESRSLQGELDAATV